MLFSSAPAAAAADAPLAARGTLRVLLPPAPSDPAYAGIWNFDREILSGFARVHGLRLVDVTRPTYDDLVTSLARGEGDIIGGGITATAERRRVVDFSEEILPVRTVALSRRPHPPVRTLADLRAARVGTTRGTTWLAAVKAAGVPGERIDDSIPWWGLPDALKAGRIDVAVTETYIAIPAMKRDGEVELGLFLGQPESIAYGVRRGDGALRQAVDEYLSNIKRSSAWSRYLVKHFGEAVLEMLRKSRVEAAPRG